MKDFLMTLLDQPANRAVQLLRLQDDFPFDVFKRFDSVKTVADYKLHLKAKGERRKF